MIAIRWDWWMRLMGTLFGSGKTGYKAQSFMGLPIMFYKGSYPSPDTIRHEKIHVRQGIECLWIGMWLFYGGSWLYWRIRGYDSYEAYMRIPFEREAYLNDHIPKYLETRKLYAWMKFL